MDNITVEKQPVYPPNDDVHSYDEISIQRSKWQEFLQSNKYSSKDTWLWQYWRNESRPITQFQKKLLSIFSYKLKGQKIVKDLIRNGIPPEMRGDIWWICSGASEKMKQESLEGDYESLLSRSEELDDTEVGNDIEKDLRRTLPACEWIQSQQGYCTLVYMTMFIYSPLFLNRIESLRNVLRAYALRNPVIGYCQSMNYICGLLLLHMSEERAFWLLVVLIEDILPFDYYDKSMLGCRIDQQVFHSCIAWKLPNIHNILKKTNSNLNVVLYPWFLCAYINVLPLDVVCRIWDCLFWEGDIVLFRIGLGLLYLKKDKLLNANDIINIYMILKSGNQTTGHYEFDYKYNELDCSLTTKLYQCCFGKYGKIGALPKVSIEKLRSKFRIILAEREAVEESQSDTITDNESLSTTNEDNTSKIANLAESPKSSEKRRSNRVSMNLSSTLSSISPRTTIDAIRDTVIQTFRQRTSSTAGTRWSLATDLVFRAMEEDGVQGLALLAEEMNQDHLYNVIDQSVDELLSSNHSEEEEDTEVDHIDSDISLHNCSNDCNEDFNDIIKSSNPINKT